MWNGSASVRFVGESYREVVQLVGSSPAALRWT